MPLIRTQSPKTASTSQTAKGLSLGSFAAQLCALVRTGARRLRHAPPWTHLATLFTLHIVGALLIKGFLNSRHPGRLAALSGLVAGLAVCLWARKRFTGKLPSPWVRLLPALCYAFFIASMSHQPLGGVRLPVSGDAFHPVVYACLAVFLGWFRLPVLQERRLVPFALWVAVPGALFAFTDEWHQSWIPGRCRSASDVLLDLIGLCLGTGGVVFLHRWAPQWKTTEAKTATQEPSTAKVTASRP